MESPSSGDFIPEFPAHAVLALRSVEYLRGALQRRRQRLHQEQQQQQQRLQWRQRQPEREDEAGRKSLLEVKQQERHDGSSSFTDAPPEEEKKEAAAAPTLPAAPALATAPAAAAAAASAFSPYNGTLRTWKEAAPQPLDGEQLPACCGVKHYRQQLLRSLVQQQNERQKPAQNPPLVSCAYLSSVRAFLRAAADAAAAAAAAAAASDAPAAAAGAPAAAAAGTLVGVAGAPVAVAGAPVAAIDAPAAAAGAPAAPARARAAVAGAPVAAAVAAADAAASAGSAAAAAAAPGDPDATRTANNAPSGLRASARCPDAPADAGAAAPAARRSAPDCAIHDAAADAAAPDDAAATPAADDGTANAGVGSEEDVVLVLGNVSADLDSVAAAVGYAMLLEACRFSCLAAPSHGENLPRQRPSAALQQQWQDHLRTAAQEQQQETPQEDEATQQAQGEDDGEHNKKMREELRPRFIPVINCCATEFALRLQVEWWLEKMLGISPRVPLLFRDAASTTTLLQPREGRRGVLLCLVDHNVLAPQQRSLQGNVVAVVDHHAVAPEAAAALKPCLAVDVSGPCIGSASTLVTHLVMQLQAAEAAAAGVARFPSPPLPVDALQLLLGAIVIDTNACDPLLFRSRWTQPDQDAMQYLWTHAAARMHACGFNSPAAVAAAFAAVQYDVTRQLRLGLPALLRADFKTFCYRRDTCGMKLQLGFSSVTVPLSELLSLAPSSAAVAERTAAGAAVGGDAEAAARARGGVAAAQDAATDVTTNTAGRKSKHPSPECGMLPRNHLGPGVSLSAAVLALMQERRLDLFAALSHYRETVASSSPGPLQRQLLLGGDASQTKLLLHLAASLQAKVKASSPQQIAACASHGGCGRSSPASPVATAGAFTHALRRPDSRATSCAADSSDAGRCSCYTIAGEKTVCGSNSCQNSSSTSSDDAPSSDRHSCQSWKGCCHSSGASTQSSSKSSNGSKADGATEEDTLSSCSWHLAGEGHTDCSTSCNQHKLAPFLFFQSIDAIYSRKLLEPLIREILVSSSEHEDL